MGATRKFSPKQSQSAGKGESFGIVKETASGKSAYYVTKSSNGSVVERTRVLVPSKDNVFFSRSPEKAKAD
jgi:hypothetical protein